MTETAKVLAEVRQRHPRPFAVGSDAERAAIERFKAFFATFAEDKVERLLDQTYAEDIFFNDTLKEIRGRELLRPYLQHSASAVDACTVEVHDVTSNGDGDYFFRWSMMIRFKRFQRGTDTWSIGISHIRFDADGRVLYHQDYWNAADGLFQHVPVLGWMIRAIKKKL